MKRSVEDSYVHAILGKKKRSAAILIHVASAHRILLGCLFCQKIVVLIRSQTLSIMRLTTMRTTMFMQRLSLTSKYVVLCTITILIYLKKSKMRHIYTDWSSLWNPWPWWRGYVLLDEESKTKVEWSWWAHDTTNNRMELQAVIEGLKQVLKRNDIVVSTPQSDQWLGMFWEAQWWSQWWMCDDEVVVFTDSNYVKQWITEWITYYSLNYSLNKLHWV